MSADLTNADHVIIQLKSRYSWFANHIAKMDKLTKQALRDEWGRDLNEYGEGHIAYALQKSREHFNDRMQPLECLKRFKALCDDFQRFPPAMPSLPAEDLQKLFDDHLKDWPNWKDRWPDWKMKYHELHTKLANQSLQLRKAL